jgi:anti-sigma regulatory factor (Ser/Thr protein kinase)
VPLSSPWLDSGTSDPSHTPGESRPHKGLRPGGLGLMLTQQLVDELVYNELRNEVVLIKYL